jgi:predicted nucleic acid-binding protein
VFPAPFRVVLDACVLFPFSLRDTLLRAAEAGFFQLYWSSMILDETSRNLVATGTTTEEQASRLLATMRRAFPEALVTDYAPLIASMRNQPKDRHVVAAAVKAGAQVIVTSNLRDFYDLPDGIEVQSPDEFLSNLFDLDPEHFLELLRRQAAALRRPPRSLDDILIGLEKFVPGLVKAVRINLRSP